MRYKFSDLYYDDTKNAKKLKSSEYKNVGKYIIVDQGKSLIAGYTDNEDGLYTDVPAIIFGDHTRNIKYIDSPFFLGADGTKVLKSPLKSVNYKYLYYLLKNASIPDTGYNRHFKWVKELMFKYHSQEQQNQIVTILDKLDSTIIKYREELSLLDELVRARFVEMFGDPVSNSKDLPIQKMNNVAPICQYDGSFEERVWLLNLDMVESQTGRIINYNIVGKDAIGGSVCTFDENNILYSKLRPYLNKVVIPNGKGYATSELVPLRPDNKIINRIYLAYLLRSNEFVEMIKEKVAGAKMPRVSMSDFREFNVPVPPLEFQNQFASFVQEIDKSRSRIQKSLEASQELFDSLMQEYFG